MINGSDSDFLKSRYTLAVIVPFTRMGNKIENLKSWLSDLPDARIQIILVHDIQDLISGENVKKLLEEIDDSRVYLGEGFFNSPGLARNFGMKFAQAEWTWFVDCDDIPQLRIVLKELEKVEPEIEIMVGSYSIISQNSAGVVEKKITSNSVMDIAREPGLWRIVFRSTILQGVTFSEFKMGEDQLFLIDVGLPNRRMKFVRSQFYSYFRNVVGQLTSNQKNVKELNLVLPLVTERLKSANVTLGRYLEVVMARQLVTSFKNAQASEIMKLSFQNLILFNSITLKSRLRIATEVYKLFRLKLVPID